MSLTKHPQGSLRELLALAIPLMLSSISVTTMILADRWFLAHYSIAAHNAAVVATTLGWSFIIGWVVMANIAEVFVAQYHGAGLHKQMGVPVWQMIWLSIGSIAFFVPASIYCTEFFYGTSPDMAYEREYFSTMLLFGPFYPLFGALCSFFVGQGKPRLVTIVVVIANFVNIILDRILIFGIEGWVPSYGVQGAAIATSVATITQSAILFVAFFNKEHRTKHGSTQWKLKAATLFECIKIGLPNAVFLVCELIGFAVFYAMMKSQGLEYITVLGICQAMWLFFSFFLEGINKATSTVAGNLIGAGRSDLIVKTIRAGVVLNLVFLVVLVAFFGLGSSFVIDQFLPHADPVFIESIQGTLELCLLLMSIYLFFEGLRFQFSGVLLAAGDTIFLFVAGSSMIWMLMVLPAYFLIVKGNASIETAFSTWVVYSVVSCLIYCGRLLQGKWNTIVISSELKATRQR